MSSTISAAAKETKPMIVAFIKMKGHYNQIPATFGRLFAGLVKEDTNRKVQQPPSTTIYQGQYQMTNCNGSYAARYLDMQLIADPMRRD